MKASEVRQTASSLLVQYIQYHSTSYNSLSFLFLFVEVDLYLLFPPPFYFIPLLLGQ